MNTSSLSADDSTTTNDEPVSSTTSISADKPLHFIFLVHGWMGNDLELRYCQEALLREASHTTNNNHHQYVVYAPQDNVGQTHDGIAAGGTRLADECMRIMQSYLMSVRNSSCGGGVLPPLTTISFVGNSLGGLYARYALSKLDLLSMTTTPMIFCTTCTPHLGVSKNTYIPLPRFGEWAISNLVFMRQPTLMDLFGYSDIVNDLALNKEYTAPLSLFKKRILYANAYNTDFQVPTATAAFLSKDSMYPHERVQEDDDDGDGMYALKVETKPGHVEQGINNDDPCTALDALAWTKVFCDTRDKVPLPSIPIPFLSNNNSNKLSPDQSTFTSAELYQHLTRTQDRFVVPLGHTVMVANSKNEMYSRINQNGRPFMDRLAADMIHDIETMTNEILKERNADATSSSSSENERSSSKLRN